MTIVITQCVLYDNMYLYNFKNYQDFKTYHDKRNHNQFQFWAKIKPFKVQI